jgi:hypothetical protein
LIENKQIILAALQDPQKIRALTIFNFDFTYNLPADLQDQAFVAYRARNGGDSIVLAQSTIAPRDYGVQSVSPTQGKVQLTFDNTSNMKAFEAFFFQFGLEKEKAGLHITIPYDQYEKNVQGKVNHCYAVTASAPKVVPAPVKPIHVPQPMALPTPPPVRFTAPMPQKHYLNFGVSSVTSTDGYKNNFTLMFNGRGYHNNSSAAQQGSSSLCAHFGMTTPAVGNAISLNRQQYATIAGVVFGCDPKRLS